MSENYEIILDTHKYLLAFSLITLTSYSFYAGIIAPILSYSLKIKWMTTGYTNESRLSSIIMSLLLTFTIILSFVFTCLSKYQDITFIIQHFLETCDYWRTFQEFQIPIVLFWYIYGSLFFIASLNIGFALVSRWPNGDYKEYTPKKDTQRHAFIVVAHNSSQKIKQCINSLLSIVEPHQIFIADNGSTREEQRKIKNVCKRYSRIISDGDLGQLNAMLNEQDTNVVDVVGSDKDSDSFKSCVECFDQMENIDLNPNLDFSDQLELSISGTKISNINVANLDKGNKTFAQYSTVFALSKWLNQGKSLIDTVTIIDDDVYVPEHFPFKDISRQFEDPNKVAIAYPLNAENSNESLCASFQEVEYYSGNVARYTQDLLGSQLFCSGAIATWKINKLKDVLLKHCTTFNGEDLEMGYLLHKEKTENPSTIGFSKICTVPTVVPYHWIHWYDLFPNPVKRKISNCDCKCGEHSFFNQRLRSWDPANYQFFVKYTKVAFSSGGVKSPSKWFIRFVCLWKILGIIREMSLIIGILIPIFKIRDTEMLKVLLIFYADSIGIAWCIAMIWTWFILSRQEFTLRPDIILWYPLLFEIPYMLIIRPLSAVYSLTYYIFWKRFPKRLETQIEQDPKLKDDLEGAWETSNPLGCTVAFKKSDTKT